MITRAQAYVFPGAGLDEVGDQFMVGEDILVAPVLEKGVRSRTVHIPPGKWTGHDGAEEWEVSTRVGIDYYWELIVIASISVAGNCN